MISVLFDSTVFLDVCSPVSNIVAVKKDVT